MNKSRQQQPKTAGNVRHVREETQEEAYASQEEAFHTPATGKFKPYFIIMEVESRSLVMEIDTGASLSIISEQTKEKLWPSKRLLPTTAKLRTYSGEELPVKGTMKVKVLHKGHQNVELSLIVVNGQGPSLLVSRAPDSLDVPKISNIVY